MDLLNRPQHTQTEAQDIQSLRNQVKGSRIQFVEVNQVEALVVVRERWPIFAMTLSELIESRDGV